MKFLAGSALAVAASALLLAGTVVTVQAGEMGFLEMLFGARPAAQPAPVAQDVPTPRLHRKLGAARHRLRTQYTALPVKIRVSHIQTPLDMKQGVTAALMKDETLRPGDIVVLDTGARVFTGRPDRRHTMGEFEPVRRSPYVDKATRRLLAGMMDPAGVRPGDEARGVVAQARKSTEVVAAVSTQSTEMRVINPWQTNP